MTKPRILVLDAQNINALAFVRELGKKGYFVGVVGKSHFSLSFFSNYAIEKHVINSRQNIDRYVKSISNLSRLNDYSMIVPLSLESYKIFSENRHLLHESVKIVLPPQKGMHIASNKHKTFNYAKKKGIGIPKTFEVNKKTVKSLSSFIKEVGFPLVLKGSISGVDNLRYCNNISDLVLTLKLFLSREKTIICQEYVVGETHGFYAYYADGKIQSFFMHQRIKQYPLTGGPSSVARSYHDETLYNISTKLLDGLNWNGPAMVEYKFDEKNGYRLIEINPKLWGSLDLTIKAGVNIPSIMVQHAMSKKINKYKNYKDVYFRWIFPNEFLHFFASDFKSVHLDKKIPVFSNISKSDLIPSIFQFFFSVIKLIWLLVRGNLKHPSGKPRYQL